MRKEVDDTISFDSNNKITKVMTYSLINGSSRIVSIYSRSQRFDGLMLYLVSHFDNSNPLHGTNIPTKYEELPDWTRKIFDADTRDGIESLVNSGEIRGFRID